MALILLGSGVVGQSTSGVEVSFVDTVQASFGIWAEITRRLANANLVTSVHTYKDQRINSDATNYYGGVKPDDVLSFSGISREMATEGGSLAQSSVSVTLQNSDRVWITRLLTDTVKNQLLVWRIIDDYRRTQLGVPKVIARVKQRSPQHNADGSITFTGDDSVAALLGGMDVKKLLTPHWQYTRKHFPLIEADNPALNKGILGIYGSHTNPVPSVGPGPIPVTPIAYPYVLDFGLQFGLCGIQLGTARNVVGVYANSKLISDAQSNVYCWPGSSYWNSQVVLKVGGVPVKYYTLPSGLRITCMFVFGGQWDAVMSGQTVLTAAVEGYENSAAGDGTGSLIATGPSQLLHFLKNFVFDQMTSTPKGIPVDVDNLPFIDEPSFVSVEAKQAARLAGGYLLNWVVGPDRVVADKIISEVAGSMGTRTSQKWNSALSLHTFDRTQAGGSHVASQGTKAVTLAKTFEQAILDEQHANQVTYEYGRIYSRNAMRISGAHVRDNASIRKYGRVYETSLSLPYAEKAVADDVAYRALLLRTDPPQRAKFDVSYEGLDFEVGDTRNITHALGPQSVVGAVSRPYWIEKLGYEPRDGIISVMALDQNAAAASVTIWSAVTSIIRSGNIATVTQTAHLYEDGETITFRGATGTSIPYNGSKVITYINANSYSFWIDATAPTPAVGTLEAGTVDLGQEQAIPEDMKVTDDATKTGRIAGGSIRFSLGGSLDVIEGELTSSYKKLQHFVHWVDNSDDNGKRNIYVRYWMFTANTATSVRFRLMNSAGGLIYESDTSTSLVAGYNKKGTLVKITGALTADENSYHGEYKGSNATNKVYCSAEIVKK